MHFILVLTLIFLLMQFIIISLIFSNLIVDIQECNILYNYNLNKKIDVKKLKINIKLYIFKFIKILNIKIYENYCEIFKIRIELNMIKKLKDKNEKVWFFIIKNIKKLNPEIQKFNMNLKIGTDEPIVTTFSIPIVSTFVSMILTKNIKKYDKKNYDFKITPIFMGNNILFLHGNAILSFDTIKVLYFIKKHK